MEEMKLADYKIALPQAKELLENETEKLKRLMKFLKTSHYPNLWQDKELVKEWQDSGFEVKYFKKRTIRKETKELLESFQNINKSLGIEEEITNFLDNELFQRLDKEALSYFPKDEEAGHEALELSRKIRNFLFDVYEINRFVSGVNELFTYGVKEGDTFIEQQMKKGQFEEEIVMYSFSEYYFDGLSRDWKEKIDIKTLVL